MTQEIYNPNPGFSNPHIKDFDEYLSLYKESIENPEKFFGNLAKENISWIEDFKDFKKMISNNIVDHNYIFPFLIFDNYKTFKFVWKLNYGIV